MKKSFKNGFDTLLTGTTTPRKQIEYTRTTIAIKNELLEKIKVSCLIHKKRFRDIVNDLIQGYLDNLEKK